MYGALYNTTFKNINLSTYNRNLIYIIKYSGLWKTKGSPSLQWISISTKVKSKKRNNQKPRHNVTNAIKEI